ncbi:hypothetical protein [Dryocola clanedunensis]
MGLDLWFFEQMRALPDSDHYETTGYFRKVNPLLYWIDRHVGQVYNRNLMEITEMHLILLLSDLQSLTPDNCCAVFPTIEGFFYGYTDYGEAYWQDIHTLTRWVKETLDTFDFDKNRLLFYAWW